METMKEEERRRENEEERRPLLFCCFVFSRGTSFESFRVGTVAGASNPITAKSYSGGRLLTYMLTVSLPVTHRTSRIRLWVLKVRDLATTILCVSIFFSILLLIILFFSSSSSLIIIDDARVSGFPEGSAVSSPSPKLEQERLANRVSHHTVHRRVEFNCAAKDSTSRWK